MKLVQCRGKSFELYEYPDCTNHGINPVANWRDARKGDWIKTADGKVIKVFGRTTKIQKRRKNQSHTSELDMEIGRRIKKIFTRLNKKIGTMITTIKGKG